MREKCEKCGKYIDWSPNLCIECEESNLIKIDSQYSIAVEALGIIANNTYCKEEQGLAMAEYFHNIAIKALIDIKEQNNLKKPIDI